MVIKIPIQNNVEVIIADVYVKVEIKLNEQSPIRTTEGKAAFESIQARLRNLSYKMANEILEEFKISANTEEGKSENIR